MIVATVRVGCSDELAGPRRTPSLQGKDYRVHTHDHPSSFESKPELLEHANRCNILGVRERYQSTQAENVECRADPSGCGLCRKAVTPELRRQAKAKINPAVFLENQKT